MLSRSVRRSSKRIRPTYGRRSNSWLRKLNTREMHFVLELLQNVEDIWEGSPGVGRRRCGLCSQGEKPPDGGGTPSKSRREIEIEKSPDSDRTPILSKRNRSQEKLNRTVVILLNICIETCAAPAQCHIVMRANSFPLPCGLSATGKSSITSAALFFKFKHTSRSYEC